MRVLNIQNQNNYYRPVCKSVHNPMYNASGKILRCNTTCLYRNDLQWGKLISHIIEKYKDVGKVNIYDYACSNGSEAYTILIELIEQSKDIAKAAKFCPIIAKDYSQKILEEANTRKIMLSQGELDYVDYVARNNPDKSERYFKKTGGYFVNLNAPSPIQYYYYVKDVLKNRVEYSCADILKDYINMKPENSVVFCRNVWPYLEENNRLSLAENLYKHLDNSSMLIIGDFDNADINTKQLLENVGFKENPNLKNVFAK